MFANLIARVRGKSDTVQNLPSGGEGVVNVNPRGDLLISQGISPRGDITRMRNSYMAVASSAVAPVVAIPTTTARVTLWNGEPDGGRSYIIEAAFLFISASAA